MLHYSRSKQNYHNYGLRALMSKHVELIGTHSALKSVFVTLPDIHILATTSQASLWADGTAGQAHKSM